MKRIITCGLASGLTIMSQTSYQTAVGLHLGFPTGLSFRHFIRGSSADGTALELIVGWGPGFGWWSSSLLISGYLEIQKPVKPIENLFIFLGGGVHTGFYRWYKWEGPWWDEYRVWHTAFSLGMSGIAGGEYVLDPSTLPFSLGIDLGVTLMAFLGEYVNPVGMGLTGGAFARYYLK